MPHTPNGSNRYLLSYFSTDRGRWIADTTHIRTQAIWWAQDLLMRPSLYSDVTVRDLCTGEHVPTEFDSDDDKGEVPVVCAAVASPPPVDLRGILARRLPTGACAFGLLALLAAGPAAARDTPKDCLTFGPNSSSCARGLAAEQDPQWRAEQLRRQRQEERNRQGQDSRAIH